MKLAKLASKFFKNPRDKVMEQGHPANRQSGLQTQTGIENGPHQCGKSSKGSYSFRIRSVKYETVAKDSLLLPAATQSLIYLDQSNELVGLGLREPQLGRKRIRFVGQHFQVIGGAGLETHL